MDNLDNVLNCDALIRVINHANEILVLCSNLQFTCFHIRSCASLCITDEIFFFKIPMTVSLMHLYVCICMCICVYMYEYYAFTCGHQRYMKKILLRIYTIYNK